MTINKRTVDALKPAARDHYLWDAALKGFGVKITPAGRKVYLVQYRLGGRRGRTRRVTIGVHGKVTAEEARSRARRLLGDIAAGRDPASDRDQIKFGLFVSEALQRFLREHVDCKRKDRTIKEYRGIARRTILPHLGKRLLSDVQASDITRLHQEMADTPYAANRALALLSKFFNWCEQYGLRPEFSNPCRHIEKYPERSRERYLSPLELERLERVLEAELKEARSSPWAIAAIRLLIHTGARLSEILTLKWDHVDKEAAVFRLPDSKVGARVIHLSEQALNILGEVPRTARNPYVICGQRHGQHLVNLEKPWRRIRKRADLDDVRLHDLRHSFASFAVASGLSLPMIGALLGHTQPQTTARYAHLASDPLKQALERVATTIAGASSRSNRDSKS